jgi:hypothetical protein
MTADGCKRRTHVSSSGFHGQVEKVAARAALAQGIRTDWLRSLRLLAGTWLGGLGAKGGASGANIQKCTCGIKKKAGRYECSTANN